MTTRQHDVQPCQDAEVQEALRCLFASLVEEGLGPRDVLDRLYRTGFQPECLVGPTRMTWQDSPSRGHLLVLRNLRCPSRLGPV